MRCVLSFAIGAFLSWLITTDHYGRFFRASPTGLACRLYGMDTVLVGPFGSVESVCIDLSYATPEDHLWQDFMGKIYDIHSFPR